MKITAQTFLIADLHLGHSKMWSEWKHRQKGFEEEIIKAWNSVVTKRDVVLCLGDLTITNKEKTKKWTDQLRGIKYLIRGNHDGGSDTWFRDVGFEIIPSVYQVFKDKYGNSYTILFTHEPVLDLPDKWFNIHGHLHGDSHRVMNVGKAHTDVGVDCLEGYKPIRLYEVLKDIASI